MERNDAALLSVVMPAYNEGNHIRSSLFTVSEVLRENFGNDYEIIAVNDGSTDSTWQQIREAAAADPHIIDAGYPVNHGKGYAITTGIGKARGSYVAFLDADLELPPTLLKPFMDQLQREGADIVIGSKQHPDSELHYPLVRKCMSYGYYRLLKLLFHLNVHDTQTGIKLFKAEVIKPIAASLSISGYAFDIEILVAAHRKGYRISEAPIVLNYHRDDRKNGRRIRLKDIWQVWKDTLAVWKKYRSSL